MREAIAYSPDELKRYELLDQYDWEDLLRSMAAIDLCEAREWQRKPVRSDVGRRQPQRKACALATGVFRGSAATWAWRRAGRAARNAKAAAELPSAVPAEPLSAARGGGAKRSRASKIEGVWPWFGFRKGEGGKARLLR